MILKYDQLQKLSKEYGDSFYMLNSDKFKENYISLLKSFKDKYAKTSIGYSYKTNYIPKLCSIVSNLGGYAEVVSQMELELAYKIGVKPDRIIFNGPYKSIKSLEKNLLNGAKVNIDSTSEIEKIILIASKYKPRNFKVGIRCNFEISGLGLSRFGINYTNGELEKAIKSIKKIQNITIAGIHCHFPNRDLKSFEERLDKMIEISKKMFNHNLEYIDIGGGFFGNMEDSLKTQFSTSIPSYKDYANLITDKVNNVFFNKAEHLKPELIIEPGSALAADTMSYYVRVISIKKVKDIFIATVSGSKFNITPQSDSIDLPFKVIKKTIQKDIKKKFKIAGYTCIESDYLSKECLESIEEKDFIEYKNVGSYSIVLKPPFIHTNVPIIEVSEKKETEVIKVKEEMDHVFQTYNF